MRLRILLEPHHGATYAQILALAKAAEEGGFDAFFRSDHYLGIDADDTPYQPTDSWTTLAGLGVQTERVRLGTLVNASTFRLPGQLAVDGRPPRPKRRGAAGPSSASAPPGMSGSTTTSASRSRPWASASTGSKSSLPSSPASGTPSR